MSNIINVKEERNVLSFVGEVFNIVANSTNFYLKFELDSEWEQNKIVTAIFNFDGRYEYVELDENRMCQIPPTNSSRIWFCLTTEPDEVSKLSSTILSLDVEASGETDISHIEEYQNTHSNLLGVVQDLLTGNNIKAKYAEFANVAEVSQTQVSLTGDEEVAGEKNFIGTLKQNSNVVLDYGNFVNENLIINPNFTVTVRNSGPVTRNGEDVYTCDRWILCKGNGKFVVGNHYLTGQDETSPTVLCQWVEDSRRFIYGETITVSATISGVRYSKTIILPESYEEDYIENIYADDNFGFRIYVHAIQCVLGVQFLASNGVSIKIEKVKLELSKFETKYLERKADVEAELCRRYFQKLRIFSLGFGVSDEAIRIFVQTPLRIRGVVNVLPESPKFLKDGATASLDGGEVVRKEIVENGVLIDLSSTGHTKYEPYFFVIGRISIDGEIYI